MSPTDYVTFDWIEIVLFKDIKCIISTF